MATTTNYSWNTPDNTAYVKDGASAIRTLGSSVDTTLFTALGGAYPGLRLVKKQTVGSAVASVAVTSAFSATYENYRIIYSGGSSSTNANITMIMDAVTSNYYYYLSGNAYSGTVVNTGSKTAANYLYAGSLNGTTGPHLDVEVASPFLSKRTVGRGSYVTVDDFSVSGFMLNNTSSYTGFTLTAGAGTMTGGTIYVYGYGIS
jgi:hypothetical protein